MSAAAITAPACRTFFDAGAATRSGATVRLSGAWLRKASWRSCADGVAGCGARPRLARSAGGVAVAVGCAKAPALAGRVSVEANNLLRTKRTSYYAVDNLPRGTYADDRRFGLSLMAEM